MFAYRTGERPFIIVVYGLEVASPNPRCVLVGMSTFCPTPKVIPHPVRDIVKGFFTNHTLVVVSKTSEYWI